MSDIASIRPGAAVQAGPAVEGIVAAAEGSPDSFRWAPTVAFGAAYVAALLLLVWSRLFEPAFLLGGSGAIIVAIGAARLQPAPASRLPASLLLLALALAFGFYTDHQLDRLAVHWETLVAGREAQLVRELDQRMAAVVARGRNAATQGADRASHAAGREIFSDLEAVWARTRVDALVVFDGAGEAVAWAGEHRGPIPAEARSGDQEILYAERPLFSYLYVVRPVEGRGDRVVAAILLQTGFDADHGDAVGIAEAFAQKRGARPYFAAGAGPGAAWHLVQDGDTIAHAQFDPVRQSDWRANVASAGRHLVVPLVVVALILLSLAWRRSRSSVHDRTIIPLLGATIVLAIAPLGPVLGAERLFSPALFLLPVQGEISLGRLMAVMLPLAALAAAARPSLLDRRAGWTALGLGMLAVGLGYAGGLRLLVAGAAPSLLEGGIYFWGVFHVVALLMLTTLASLALPQGRAGGIRPVALGGGVLLSILLAVAMVVRWWLWRTIDPWLPALWALPFALLAIGIMQYVGRASRLARWLVAGWLAASAVLPHLWVTQNQAKLEAAERALATLGMRPDPFLDYLLHQFAVETERRQARGEDGVELLYRSWVASGMAREAYPARLSIWTAAGGAEADLVLGDAATTRHNRRLSSLVVERAVGRARRIGQPVVESAPGAPGVSQVMAVPLADGRVVSISVPPRRSFEHSTFLAPILGAEPRPDIRLTLVPALTSGSRGPEAIAWRPTDHGWRSEALLRYPEGEYHAHLELRLPSTGVLVARALLLVALDLWLIVLLWLIGRAARGEPPAPPGGWRAWSATFRARVTVALFAFFLLPTILFGAAAYRALAGEAARTARVVAERAADQATRSFAEVPGNWRAIAGRVGEEVLYYHRGELAQSSSPETVELGFFGAWMPPAVFRALQSGEEISAVETRTLGGRPYLIVYRRLPAGTLAVPVSLSAGESVLRQQELAHLILFAALVGALLSLALSVAVGRALARPIGQLRRAAAAVGGGQLRVRLPETDAGEFGELFGSFNRMVRRLRRARAKEVRTARVLAWGEMSRQVAHEIKNPLTPIKLSVQHLRRAFADGRADFGQILEANVGQVLVEIDRLSEIARAFSRFGAPAQAAGPLVAVDVASVVREVTTLYRAGEAAIVYRSAVEESLPPVRARAGELKEVLLNLLENARAALEENGTVVLSARREGDAIELCVGDDGPGIPPELLPRIFEPHFSTRSAGTGLGLAIVRRLVEAWGGSVIAESEVGQGTTIRLRLPVAEA